MKRILFLGIIIMFIFTSIAGAEIRRIPDVFTNGIVVLSDDNSKQINNISNLRSLYFRKIISEKDVEYYIKADNEIESKYILAKSPVEISIGSHQYILECKNYKIFTPLNGKTNAVLTVKIPQEVIEKLQITNRVALRFTQNNGNQFVYVLPDEVLAEWKQVIVVDK